MAITRLGYKFLELSSNVEVVQNAGDYRLLSRRVVNELGPLSRKEAVLPRLGNVDRF